MRRKQIAEQAASLPWVGYIRVSTDEQADSGLGLDSQEEKIRAMAVVKGVALSEVIRDEGESAKTLNRPGAQRLMEMIRKRSIQGVIIAKLDRLTRKLHDLTGLMELLEHKRVDLISTSEAFDTSTAGGRLCMNIFGAVSQWEREVICERTRDGLAQLRRRGEHAGTVRYGYRSTGRKSEGGDGRVVEEPNEQEIIKAIQRRHKDGASLLFIANWLNMWGFRTRRGSEWRPQYVDSIIRSYP